MKFVETGFAGLIEIFPQVLSDTRGWFFESYNQDKFRSAGINTKWIQDNQSFSSKNVVRGLHFQRTPYAQAKLVRVITGKVLDIVVDLRQDQPTYGKHFKCVLEAITNNMLLVPAGFAHGFAALEDSIFHYKCDNFYHKASEGGIKWNDPALHIDWEVENPVVSEKDQMLPDFDSVVNTLN